MDFLHSPISRRHALIASAITLTGPAAYAADTPSAFPSGPIRLIVIFPAGGGTDAAARLAAPKLAARLGQPVVVDNKPGMGGGIGMDAVAKAAPDGLALVLTSSGGLTALPSLYKKLPFDPEKDLAPVSMFGVSPLVIAVRSDFPASNVKELMALAKQKPGSLFYGSGGNGTAPHLAAELFKSMAGVDLVHVPYKGNGPAIVSLLGGEIPLVFSDMGTVRPYLGNRLKLIGVLGNKRAASAPEVPTLAESGLPGYEAEGWFAVMAPAATPSRIVDRLNHELVAILSSPEARAQFAASGLEAVSSTPAELAQRIKEDTARWSQVIKTVGITVD
ncbi:tripartite tricarboxylate transporter substrate binding protein [soil metagenome]